MQKKILIVEDEPRLVEVLSDQLKDAGFSVLIARDGEQGLAAALEHKPDLVLLDLLLPKVEGITMLKQLRSRENGKNTPVMILTNLSDTKNVNEALKYGAYNFLVKANWDVDSIVEEIKTRLA